MRSRILTLCALSALCFSATAQSSGESLIREPVAAPSQGAEQAIQTKALGNGSIHLMKAKVVGAILHVEFVAVPPKKADGSYSSFSISTHKLKNFDYIDETTSKKVTLLQDEDGKYMADPLSGTGGELLVSGSQPKTLSLKFPAPPETSPTITIDFPGVGAFDSVPVSR
ncbi:phosphoribosylglycinamide synthetase [Vandammella animalimorsus]|uniref:Phosphoribosylglycinamide synthetase n=1 Tax=Vandammella animalimorsus TaxID=2029117 RepID=A0A2A2AVF7_9BURK|nr:phosphoribosylglycinamide synthetase [Vandammella animalimorsus]PAT41723.1 phosphoribosylglycinamide synthetase [Vandammella animalimorsus]